MNVLACLSIALFAVYTTDAAGLGKRRSHPKCWSWARKFERCLKEGYQSNRFSDCATDTRKSRQPYCVRFENYLAGSRCDYDCPKAGAEPTCESATQRCNLDRNCNTKLEVYQEECALMSRKNMTSCTESCFKAYHHLRRDETGRVLVEQQCEELGVKGVTYRCVSEPVSRLCVRSVEQCSTQCKTLANDVTNKCFVGNPDRECTEECRAAYLAIRADVGSGTVVRDCHGVDRVLKIKCDVYA